MWPKLNTMKHFVTLATLLTSLSAFAQLPYNPDANNDGQIGAFDLTSLLSVYSGSFSNGVLASGTAMATYLGGYYECNSADSYVVDVYQFANDEQESDSFFYITVNGAVNGTTIHLILPPGDFDTLLSVPNYPEPGFTVNSPFDEIGDSSRSLKTLVFWNGRWHPDF